MSADEEVTPQDVGRAVGEASEFAPVDLDTLTVEGQPDPGPAEVEEKQESPEGEDAVTAEEPADGETEAASELARIKSEWAAFVEARRAERVFPRLPKLNRWYMSLAIILGATSAVLYHMYLIGGQ